MAKAKKKPSNLTNTNDAIAKIQTGVTEQISELIPALTEEPALASLLSSVNQLQELLSGFPSDPALDTLLSKSVQAPIAAIAAIQSGKRPISDLGKVLAVLYTVQQKLAVDIPQWQSQQSATDADGDKLNAVVLAIIAAVNKVLNTRPDVESVMSDLSAIKSLQGGPADAVAFHDFNVLQIAFRSIWMNSFDDNLKQAAAKLYQETAKLYDDTGLGEPDYQAISDVEGLVEFTNEITSTLIAADGVSDSTLSTAPNPVATAFPGWTGKLWGALSVEQQSDLVYYANIRNSPTSSQTDKNAATASAALILSQPAGNNGRIATLINEIAMAISEPYAFDVFAPGSFNYGLMITYRQEWAPGAYQAGDLVATIPLAPGEKRSYTKKTIVKTTRAQKELAKSLSTSSTQSSEASSTQAEIMAKASASTNFKMTSKGSFNIGIGSIESTTSFAANQMQQSSMNKKAFHEATLKAAEEYRQERSIEIDTSKSVETDETSSDEISNPNNEITVTYLFYELQRRYQIREFLYRARPVILVAQEVPAPHQIDEEWLIQHQWIISRVLLDDLFRPALNYLSTGFAGDQVSTEVLKASWAAQQQLVSKLEASVSDQLAMRDALRNYLVGTALSEDIAKTEETPTWAKVLTMGMAPDPGSQQADMLEAQSKAAKTRLQYVEGSLADAQKKLTDASAAFTQATKDYSNALANQFSRQVAIDQLRVHVKDNILYYMQAKWDFEPADQRYFRLYNTKVICPDVDKDCAPTFSASRPFSALVAAATKTFLPLTTDVVFNNICVPLPGTNAGVGGVEHQLVDVADLDNPIGYKGNYLIFPLTDSCHLTTYMLSDYVNNYLGVMDPDGSDSFDAEDFDAQWIAAQTALSAAVKAGDNAAQTKAQAALDSLKSQLTAYISAIRRDTDEIIVPTGQLFIEALPGSQSILEDFKLEHRYQDVRKVKAEVRHAELENLRLASRLIGGQTDTKLLEDPDIEKKVVVEGKAGVVVADS